jgi:hypothetical protein
MTAHNLGIGAVAYGLSTGNDAMFEFGLALYESAPYFLNRAVTNYNLVWTSLSYVDPIHILNLEMVVELALFHARYDQLDTAEFVGNEVEGGLPSGYEDFVEWLYE